MKIFSALPLFFLISSSFLTASDVVDHIKTILSDQTLSEKEKVSQISLAVQYESPSPITKEVLTRDIANSIPTSPPQIKTNLKDGQAQTPFSNYTLELLARSEGGMIKSITIGGRALSFAPSGTVGVTEDIPLELGENKIELLITDNADQTLAEAITITRVKRPSQSPQQRASLAVLPLDQDSKQLTELLSQFLLETERYRLVEREKLNEIMKEQKLSNSLFSDKSTSIKLGKILSARYSLAGEVRMSNDFEAVTRMIDNESGEVLAIIDAYAPNIERGELKYSLRHLAGKIKQALPWFESDVLSQNNGQIYLSKPEHLQPVNGMDFMLIRKEPDLIDESTGIVLLPGQEFVLGKARLEQVSRKGIICTLEKPISDISQLKAVSR